MEIKTKNYRFVVYPDVLFIEAFGTWNEKITREGLLSFTDLVFEHYINKEWAILVDIKDCNLNITGAKTILKDIFNGITMLPTHVVHVVGGTHAPSKKGWYANQPVRKRGNLQIAFFSTQKEAETWLDSCGYRMLP